MFKCLFSGLIFCLQIWCCFGSTTHELNEPSIANNKSSEKTASTSRTNWWTCSMHPQIKVPEFGQCPLCFMDLIQLDQSKVLPSNLIELKDEQVKSAGILTYPIQKNRDRKNLKLYGKVILKPANKFRITAWVAGRVDKLIVNSVGEKVTKGQALYEIYSPVLISAHQELIQALNLVSSTDQNSSHYKSLSINLQAIRQKLRFLGLSESELTRLENTKTLVKHITIYAQRSGIIRHVAIREGEYVKEGQAILLMADMSELWVEASVYEDDLQSMQGITQSLILLDSNPNDEILGKLIRIDPFVDANTRASRAIFSISNSKGLYHEGGYAKVQVVTYSKSGYLVPHSAPLFLGHNAVIFIKKGNQFESKVVRILEKTESYYRILGDLNEGDEVVVKGTFKLDSEFQLQAKDSMMSTKQLVTPYGSRLDLRKPVEKAQTWMSEHSADERFLDISSFLMTKYLELQISLSEDSFDESKAIFLEIQSFIEAQNLYDLPIPSQKVMKLLKLALFKDFQTITSTILFKDLRSTFKTLSLWMILMVETQWISNSENLKKLYCPVAFNNSGGFWIQEEEDIMNPYFGSKMLNCGQKLKWNK